MYADAGVFLLPELHSERLPPAAAAARFLQAMAAGDRAVLRRAAGLYQSVTMRPRDAIHAAAALETGEKEILFEDRVFDRVPGLARVWPPP